MSQREILLSLDKPPTPQACYFCEGFYAPNRGRLVCVVCHIFLCEDSDVEVIMFPSHAEEFDDDDDSGNDEPMEYPNAEARDPFERGVPLEAIAEPLNDPMSTNRLNEQVQLMDLINSLSNFSNSVTDDNTTTITCLPPEVLLSVFGYLDNFSLWSAASVCEQWRSLIKDEVPQLQWKTAVSTQWPLYDNYRNVKDWFNVYSALINSSSCISCVQQMATSRTHHSPKPDNNQNSWRNNRLSTEIKLMVCDPLEGIFAQPLDSQQCHWQATITGPVNSPYEGGKFFLYMRVPLNYPMRPPQVRFVTKIYHPNISKHGDVGLDTITHMWSLALTISKVLISVQSLLTDPCCEIAMQPDIAKVYKTDKKLFEATARAWTWKYAMTEFMVR